jgi:hypothetical protein
VLKVPSAACWDQPVPANASTYTPAPYIELTRDVLLWRSGFPDRGRLPQVQWFCASSEQHETAAVARQRRQQLCSDSAATASAAATAPRQWGACDGDGAAKASDSAAQRPSSDRAATPQRPRSDPAMIAQLHSCNLHGLLAGHAGLLRGKSGAAGAAAAEATIAAEAHQVKRVRAPARQVQCRVAKYQCSRQVYLHRISIVSAAQLDDSYHSYGQH